MSSEPDPSGRANLPVGSRDSTRPPIGDEVDETLLDWLLSLTPMQRLDILQQHMKVICDLRARSR